MQYTVRHKIIHTQKRILSTVKWAQWDKTQSTELLNLFICVCIALCTIVAHNIAQNRPDSFPSYSPDNHHCSDEVYSREGDTAAVIGCLRVTWYHDYDSSQQCRSAVNAHTHPLDLIDWVKVLRPTRHKIGHFGDILLGQFLDVVLKKLNLTQQKQTTQEQNSLS